MTINSLHYSTYDLALAAALVATGYNVYAIEKTGYGNRCTFLFERVGSLDETVQAYWANSLTINPKSYFDVLKHLKTRLYSEVQHVNQ